MVVGDAGMDLPDDGRRRQRLQVALSQAFDGGAHAVHGLDAAMRKNHRIGQRHGARRLGRFGQQQAVDVGDVKVGLSQRLLQAQRRIHAGGKGQAIVLRAGEQQGQAIESVNVHEW